jgi:hypothetical protein
MANPFLMLGSAGAGYLQGQIQGHDDAAEIQRRADAIEAEIENRRADNARQAQELALRQKQAAWDQDPTNPQNRAATSTIDYNAARTAALGPEYLTDQTKDMYPADKQWLAAQLKPGFTPQDVVGAIGAANEPVATPGAGVPFLPFLPGTQAPTVAPRHTFGSMTADFKTAANDQKKATALLAAMRAAGSGELTAEGVMQAHQAIYGEPMDPQVAQSLADTAKTKKMGAETANTEAGTKLKGAQTDKTKAETASIIANRGVPRAKLLAQINHWKAMESQGASKVAIAQYNASTSRQRVNAATGGKPLADDKYFTLRNGYQDDIAKMEASVDPISGKSKFDPAEIDTRREDLATLDESKFLGKAGRSDIQAKLAKLRALKRSDADVAGALRGSLRQSGIQDPDAIERLTVRYMNQWFRGK